MARYLVVNGPNLNLLGTRDPTVYGSTTLAELEERCRTWGAEIGVDVDTFQSNHEGALIDRLHDARTSHAGIVINPGAYGHTSYAIHDALDAVGVDTVEVHISNVAEREAWRRVSVIRPACVHGISGRGVDGYRWGMRHLWYRSRWPAETVAYSDHPDAVMDVRHPPGATAAVVVVHGGFWRHMWTRDTTDGIAVDLAERGYLTANVEYRRVGTGGGWPQSAIDLAAAIAHVAATGGIERIAVVGHSAGGQLAVMATEFGSIDYLPIAVGGVLDMEAAVADGIGDAAAAAFLGPVDPVDASPLRVPGRAIAIHGTGDDRVPVSYARAFATSGPDRELLELPGAGHFEFLEPSSEAWGAVVDLLARRLPR